MKKKQWQTHVKAFNNSGLSKRKYADSHKLIYHQFVYWSQKINQPSAEAFVPVKLMPEQPPIQKADAPMGIVEFLGGARLLIRSPELLALLPSLLAR
jgi:hypothetical protein